MVPILSLWAPILVAAVVVFVASSILHMVLPYHRSDFRKVESEDALMESLRKLGIAPGNYMMPYAGSPSAMKDPAFIEKKKKGPVAVLTVMRDPSMGASLAQWFVYCVVVSVFAAYVAGRALGPGPSTWRRSASPAPRRSWATVWRSGRTPSGTRSPGARRSSRTSTP